MLIRSQDRGRLPASAALRMQGVRPIAAFRKIVFEEMPTLAHDTGIA
jgi:hypothetical protein